MPYITIDRFPEFAVGNLPELMILPSGQPSVDKARERPRLLIEARYMRPFRTPCFPRYGIYCGSEYRGKTVASFADIRRSLIYPRLTARIEIDVIAARRSWMVVARAQHGNQECIGGIFLFSSYVSTCLHVAAWIWFCRRWIGHSWEDDSSRNRVWPTKSIETVDPRNLYPQMFSESPETDDDDDDDGDDEDDDGSMDPAVQALERLWALYGGRI
jgi:hypothetical protein